MCGIKAPQQGRAQHRLHDEAAGCVQAFSRRSVHAFRAAIEDHGSERCCVVRLRRCASADQTLGALPADCSELHSLHLIADT